MREKEKTRFVPRFPTAYKHTSSKKEKSAIADALIQCVGYKSRKHVITILSKDKNSSKASRKGRNKILNAQRVDFLRKLWEKRTILVQNKYLRYLLNSIRSPKNTQSHNKKFHL